MPLMQGSDKKTISRNISKLREEGYDVPGQAVAIALHSAGKSKETPNAKEKKRAKRTV